MRAASSGRYVFTLHTRNVASTITACRDLHIDNRSLAGNLTGIINQRLVRRLCTKCREPTKPDDSDLQLFASHGLEAPAQLFRPHGCNHCSGRGFGEGLACLKSRGSMTNSRDAVAGCTGRRVAELLGQQERLPYWTTRLAKSVKEFTSVTEVLKYQLYKTSFHV